MLTDLHMDLRMFLSAPKQLAEFPSKAFSIELLKLPLRLLSSLEGPA